MSERTATVWWAALKGVEIDMPLGMLELGHRAWFALETAWTPYMPRVEDAPESGATQLRRKLRK